MTTEAPAAVAEEADKTAATAEDEQQSNTDDTQSSETETEDTTAEADGSQSDENGNDEDDDKPKRKSRNRRYSQQAARLKAENAELKRELDKAHKAEPAVEKTKPKLDDFENVDDYDEAVIEWATEKSMAKFTKQSEAQRQAEAAAQNAQRRAQAFQEQVKEAKTYIPDFDEVIENADPDVDIAAHVQDLIIDSKRAPELAYHLAANSDTLEDLNEMSPLQAAREIGRLEATLAKPTPRKQSKAPPPVKPLKGAGSTVKPLEDLSMAEYAARRTKELYG